MLNRVRPLLLIILIVSGAINSLAQAEFGPHRLLSSPAPVLRNPTHLRIGLRQPRFVGRVGGVAFDAVAKPSDNFTFKNISLGYRRDQPDGKRLRVTFDGRQVTAPIYDWQLVPIAKFADSDYFSCVTLLGTLDDPEKTEEVRLEGGRIINYHEAFVNTLLGLRLFELDFLILDKSSADLPKQKGEYLLGVDEVAPNLESNRSGFDEFKNYFDELLADTAEPASSYVINDYGSDIRFSASGNSLGITGEPIFYFWEEDYRSVVEVEDKVEEEYQAAARRPRFNAKAWFITRLLESANEYQRNHDVERMLETPTLYSDEPVDRLKRLLSLQGDVPRRNFLQQQSVGLLKELLIYFREVIAGEKPVPSLELSRQVNSRPDLLRKINPAVWDAGVNVMRYAAFFRYYKTRYPQRWRAFVTQLPQVKSLSPQVSTFTILERGRQ